MRVVQSDRRFEVCQLRAESVGQRSKSEFPPLLANFYLIRRFSTALPVRYGGRSVVLFRSTTPLLIDHTVSPLRAALNGAVPCV